MTTQYPIPVRYVLYSHYPEGKDFDSYKPEKGPAELERVKSLVQHLPGLRGLLTWPGYEGLLVLFYAPGFAECLDGIAEGKDEETLLEIPRLRFASAVQTYLKQLLEKDRVFAPRLRFVTPLDLQKIFGRMKDWKMTDQLRSWFVGSREGGKYDSPKTVEAIVRLRLLGSGIPVFRLDHDVLFRGEDNWDKKNLEFSSTIGTCLKAYEKRRDSSNLSSFIFSASYDHQSLRNHNPLAKKDEIFSKWSRAFATRVFPALPVRRDLIARLKSKKAKSKYTWQDYAVESFSQSLAHKFFGLDENHKVSTKDGIGRIGAHPTAAVISGAMLYLSDGAILDLPPFSNFRLNVSWIDDHLKYCLHRELRHLSRRNSKAYATETRYDPLLGHARLDEVIVQKARDDVRNDLPEYLFNEYLPTLLWGTVMDAWITRDPLLKYRPEELSARDCKSFSKILRKRESEAVLPSALQKALRENDGPGSTERDSLEKKLLNAALERINEVRNQWMKLTEDGVDTFASIWAKGEVGSYFRLTLKYPGICVPGFPAGRRITNFDHIDRHLFDGLKRLVEDAIKYIEWTLKWPTIVQVLRSIEQGTLRTDLSFDLETVEHEYS